MNDRRIETPIGRHRQINGGGNIRYASEADLRDGLAAVAWFHGWDVSTEVTTSTGGRADVVLSCNGLYIPIELKLSITTKRQARLGFQQAEDYRRHFDVVADRCHGILAALEIDKDICADSAALYPGVNLRSFYHLLRIVRGQDWHGFTEHHDRAWTASRRRSDLDRLVRLARDEEMRTALDRRSQFLKTLGCNYPAMAGMLREAIAA